MPKHLLEVLIYRRADGREVSLIEFSMAELLSSSERVLLVPDGRRVSAVVNVTPIRS